VKETKEEFANRLNGYKEAVAWMCMRYPTAVGDYRRLVNYFWKYVSKFTTECEHCHKETTVWVKDFDRLASPECITRAYRKLVEKGKIREPPEVKAAKRKQAERHRRYWTIP
jgi:hypothetical protein